MNKACKEQESKCWKQKARLCGKMKRVEKENPFKRELGLPNALEMKGNPSKWVLGGGEKNITALQKTIDVFQFQKIPKATW